MIDADCLPNLCCCMSCSSSKTGAVPIVKLMLSYCLKEIFVMSHLLLLFALLPIFDDNLPPPPEVAFLCLRPDDSTDWYCTPEPPNCGTKFCGRPEPTWVINPFNRCEEIPHYDWSERCFGEDTKEATQYLTRSKIYCNPTFATSGTGFSDLITVPVVCWKWRSCANSCTQCSLPDEPIQTRNSQVAGCESFVPRAYPRFKAKCDAGAGNGDALLGVYSEDEETCIGPIVTCMQAPPPVP